MRGRLVRPQTRSLRFRCFNAKFSPNLGDGLLSECLEHRLVELGAAADTYSIDLAARTAYGDALPGRGTVLATLDALPGPMRRVAIRAPLALLSWRKWRPHYRDHLDEADAVVIGGGNLLADLDLNFPTKLSLALEEARRSRLPVAIYACGMSRDWTPAGLRMFRRALSGTDLRAVFLRDDDSCRAWNELLAPSVGRSAQVVRDPGLLASRVHARPARWPGARPVAGIGVTSALAIRYHSDRAPGAERLERWFLGLARGLVEAGHEVRLFTNGSPEDRACLERLRPRLFELGSAAQVRILSPRNPAELCAEISAFDVLVAFRLHAIIAAYSYRIPAIGLRWDRKLDSFLASVGRSAYLLDVTEAPHEEGVRLALAAERDGMPEADHAAVIDEAAADVARLFAVFGPDPPGARR